MADPARRGGGAGVGLATGYGLGWRGLLLLFAFFYLLEFVIETHYPKS